MITIKYKLGDEEGCRVFGYDKQKQATKFCQELFERKLILCGTTYKKAFRKRRKTDGYFYGQILFRESIEVIEKLRALPLKVEIKYD